MILQELLFPNYDTCPTYDMYFRIGADPLKAHYDPQKAEVFLSIRESIHLDTYFNSFSIGKWRQYTMLDNLSLELELQGAFRVQLLHNQTINGAFFTNVLGEQICRASERTTFRFNLPIDSTDKGVVCCTLAALDKENFFFGGRYTTEIDQSALNPVDLAIDICTYRRESFIERNLELLNRELIERPESDLYSHLDVFISDNGKTLDIARLSSDRVHIVPNKNVGGAGGFSRNMMEIIDFGKKRPFTHVLIMDDDVLIHTDALLRTYRLLRLLKPQYDGKTIAGAMLRLDQRHIQHECGGWWDGDYVLSKKTFVDLRSIENILRNEIETSINFNAWWFSCVPMKKISNDNLPLPLFIRFDDVEFGLRSGSDILSLNGICLWHEPFEYKYSSSMEYYHMRNCLIINAYHRPDFGAMSAVKHMIHMILSNTIRYRYNNCELIFRAVDDFCKGTDFLLHQDGEALHQEIMAASDKFLPVSQLSVPFDEEVYLSSFDWSEKKWKRLVRLATFNGLLLPAKGNAIVSAAINGPISYSRKREVLNYDVSSHRGFITKKDFWRTVGTLFRAIGKACKLYTNHRRVCRQYLRDRDILTSREFWDSYLDLK